MICLAGHATLECKCYTRALSKTVVTVPSLFCFHRVMSKGWCSHVSTTKAQLGCIDPRFDRLT